MTGSSTGSRKSGFVGVKAEFYTLSGKLFKTAEFKYDNRVKIDGQDDAPFVSELIIRDAIQQDRTTTMNYSNIKVEPISGFHVQPEFAGAVAQRFLAEYPGRMHSSLC